MSTENGFQKTTKRVLTKRGVLWLGQTCNLRCHFCYFLNRIAAKDHPEHPFMSLEKAKTICSSLVDVYGNNAIDIQGGEPTIFPEIHELSRHCDSIGLKPSLITNALVLHKEDACKKLQDAGVRDLLVSIHGLGEAYEKNVGVPNSHAKQMKALENLAKIGLPFRFNCVLAKSVLPDLVEIAKLAIDTGARVVNFITFNPFEDQQNKQRSLANVPRYTDATVELMRAFDALEVADVESNVRYLPFCMVKEKYRKNIYNFQQLPYDLHEWDYASWSWTGQTPQRMRDGDVTPTLSLRQANTHSGLFGKDGHPGYLDDESISKADEYRHSAMIRAREHCQYAYAPQCEECAMQPICDGFHGDYAGMFGADEATPINPGAQEKIDDPLYYAREQQKIVESEDYSWAL